uniref:Uncharacterized protein n=1 Tax=Arundo donax TaxID=35708 RepID=A0A0A9GN66_ARUDO
MSNVTMFDHHVQLWIRWLCLQLLTYVNYACSLTVLVLYLV